MTLRLANESDTQGACNAEIYRMQLAQMYMGNNFGHSVVLSGKYTQALLDQLIKRDINKLIRDLTDEI